MEVFKATLLSIIVIVLVVFLVALGERDNTNPSHPCSWYSNTYISTIPARCLGYFEKAGR